MKEENRVMNFCYHHYSFNRRVIFVNIFLKNGVIRFVILTVVINSFQRCKF